MKTQDILTEIEFGLQTKGYLRYRSLEREEVGISIHNNIRKIIEGIEEEIKGKGFQDSISSLIRIEDFVEYYKELDPSTTNEATGAKGFSRPEDCRTLVRAVAISTVEGPSGDFRGSVRVLKGDNIEILIDDTYHGSNVKSPVSFLTKADLFIKEEGFTISKVYATYIKHPDRIDFDKEDYEVSETLMSKVIANSIVELSAILEEENSKIQNMSNLKDINK